MSHAVAAPAVPAGFLAGRRLFDAHALPACLLCALGVAVLLAAVLSGRFGYDPAFVDAITGGAACVLAFAWTARWIGFARIADPVEQVILLFLTAMVLALCSIVFASAGAPIADTGLRAADALLFGFDRTTLIADLRLSPAAIARWALVYNSLAFTPALAMLLLGLSGHRRRAWVVLTALLGAALASIAFVAIVPAYGTPPYPYAFVDVLDGVRNGSLRTLNDAVITGVITFPSMHAADAVILAVTFSWLGRWALPLVLLNVAMFASALVVGGHYVVDLVAGAAIGLVALAIAMRVHDRIGDAAEG